MKSNRILFISTQLVTTAFTGLLIYLLIDQNKQLGQQLDTNNVAITNLANSLVSTISYSDQLEQDRIEREEAMKPLAAGTKAPNFTLVNQNNEPVSLDSYQGKKVTLVFSQKGCSYCDDYYAVVNEYSKKYKDDREVLILQAGASLKENKRLIKEQKLTSNVLNLDDMTLLTQYKVFKTPTTIVIDEQGNVKSTGTVASLEELTTLLLEDSKEQEG